MNNSVNNFSAGAARQFCRGGRDFLLFWVLALLLISIRPVPGQTINFIGGPGGSIPDSSDLGTNAWNPGAGVFLSDIVVTNAGLIGSFNSVTLDTFAHTAIGDLVFEITHVDSGTTVIFLQRAQKTDPTQGYGSAVDLNGDFTFTNDLASTFNSLDSIWHAAFVATNSGSGIINGGSFAASSNAFGGTASTSYQPSDFNDFAGQTAAGTWRLTVLDEATNDVGSLAGWSFNATLTSVPEPTGPLLFFAGVIVITASIARWRDRKV